MEAEDLVNNADINLATELVETLIGTSICDGIEWYPKAVYHQSASKEGWLTLDDGRWTRSASCRVSIDGDKLVVDISEEELYSHRSSSDILWWFSSVIEEEPIEVCENVAIFDMPTKRVSGVIDMYLDIEDLAECEHLDGEFPVVHSWWIVDANTGKNLTSVGEHVVEALGVYVWGRTERGHSMYLDRCWQRLAGND